MSNDKPQPSSHPSPRATPRPKRWIPPAWVWAILALLAAVAVWVRVADPMGDRGHVNVYTFLLAGLAFFVLLAWFTFWSGHGWRVRLLPLVATIVGVALFTSFFRLKEVSGEMVPIFELRGAEESARRAAERAAARVDLATTTENDFPQFLGPGRDLGIDHLELARDWQARPPELVWRQEIGGGWSGFSVVNGFAVTMEQRGDAEAVTVYDVETGELLWSHEIPGRYELLIAGEGPRATPTIDEGRVYALGATGRLVALDGATGELLWEKDLLREFGMTPEQEAADLPYGRSNSPLVVDELLVVPAGGPSAGRPTSLVAYDKVSGREAWRAGERQISCSSPAVATLAGKRQILIVNEDTVSGHDVESGRILWEHPREGQSNSGANVSQAVPIAPDRVFVSKGYGLGAALLELEPRADGTFAVEELWADSKVLRTKFTNVAIYEGYVYGLSDGILECVELETGERAWKRGRYRHGQILRVGGVLLVLSEDGEVAMVEATPERPDNVLGRFQAIEGKTWNNLALYGPHLLVRNAQEAACYRLPLES